MEFFGQFVLGTIAVMFGGLILVGLILCITAAASESQKNKRANGSDSGGALGPIIFIILLGYIIALAMGD